MQMPNPGAAIIDPAKIRDYVLNPTHPRGKHKARVFQAVLGLTADDTEEFVAALADSAHCLDAIIGTSDLFGARYIIDFEFKRANRSAMIRGCWIVLQGEEVARFVTCYIL